MSGKSSSTASALGGIGFFGLLAIVFIVLKILGYIDWHWIWVLSPIWISCLLSLVALFVFLALLVIGELLK